MMPADWIEQALELKGESYLKTPEEELSWFVLYNIDVYLMFALLLGTFAIALGLTVMRIPNFLPSRSKATYTQRKAIL